MQFKYSSKSMMSNQSDVFTTTKVCDFRSQDERIPLSLMNRTSDDMLIYCIYWCSEQIRFPHHSSYAWHISQLEW